MIINGIGMSIWRPFNSMGLMVDENRGLEASQPLKG